LKRFGVVESTEEKADGSVAWMLPAKEIINSGRTE
jgi:hypothetical protein